MPIYTISVNIHIHDTTILFHSVIYCGISSKIYVNLWKVFDKVILVRCLLWISFNARLFFINIDWLNWFFSLNFQPTITDVLLVFISWKFNRKYLFYYILRYCTKYIIVSLLFKKIKCTIIEKQKQKK